MRTDSLAFIGTDIFLQNKFTKVQNKAVKSFVLHVRVLFCETNFLNSYCSLSLWMNLSSNCELFTVLSLNSPDWRANLLFGTANWMEGSAHACEHIRKYKGLLSLKKKLRKATEKKTGGGGGGFARTLKNSLWHLRSMPTFRIITDPWNKFILLRMCEHRS